MSGNIDGFPKDLLKKFPKIETVFLEINTMPEIQNWVKKHTTKHKIMIWIVY